MPFHYMQFQIILQKSREKPYLEGQVNGLPFDSVKFFLEVLFIPNMYTMITISLAMIVLSEINLLFMKTS